MANDPMKEVQDAPGIEIGTDEKPVASFEIDGGLSGKGMLTGSGTLSIQFPEGIKAGVKYEDLGNGKMKVTFNAGDTFKINADDSIGFEGDLGWDTTTGKFDGIGKLTFEVDKTIALGIKAQIDSGGLSESASLKINF